MGMQLSRLGFHANTPIDGFAPIASSPFIASLVTPGPAPVVADPTPAPMPDVSMTDAEMLNAIRRGGPAWYVYAAVAVVIVIVALILVL
jgi:hypothetical protein